MRCKTLLASVLIEAFNLALVLGHCFGVVGVACLSAVAHLVPHGGTVLLVHASKDWHVVVQALAHHIANQRTLVVPLVKTVEQFVYLVGVV